MCTAGLETPGDRSDLRRDLDSGLGQPFRNYLTMDLVTRHRGSEASVSFPVSCQSFHSSWRFSQSGRLVELGELLVRLSAPVHSGTKGVWLGRGLLGPVECWVSHCLYSTSTCTVLWSCQSDIFLDGKGLTKYSTPTAEAGERRSSLFLLMGSLTAGCWGTESETSLGGVQATVMCNTCC